MVALQVRAIRQRRGMTAQQLVDRCTAQGFVGMTANMLANIETGRRDVSVDELLAFALALDVPPASLLTPAHDRPLTVAVTDQVTVTDRDALSDWICGHQPLPPTDERLYISHTAEQMPFGRTRVTGGMTTQEFQAKAGRLLSQFTAELDDTVAKVRGRFAEALDGIVAQADQGASSTELLRSVEAVQRRLESSTDRTDPR
ncbi:helix-turn-helix domain-containing protein [Cryptosporangium sp. NPDC048952]|uniref:helix-turn-helix domain-containing protein n=1 Tax=Cryptosporangium sp. NPDC048952 TaxID=3363961 RepID=UPI0037172CDF